MSSRQVRTSLKLLPFGEVLFLALFLLASCQKHEINVRSDDVLVSSEPFSDSAYRSLSGSDTPFRIEPVDGKVILTYAIASEIEVEVNFVRLKTRKVSKVTVEQFLDAEPNPVYSEVTSILIISVYECLVRKN